MVHYIIQQSVVQMFEHPSFQSKVVSQALFSEEVKVKEGGPWLYIFTPDGYGGWVAEGSIVERNKPYKGNLRVDRLTAHLYGERNNAYAPLQTLPYGSVLEELELCDERWVKVLLPNEREGFIQRGDLCEERVLSGKGELVPLSLRFLHLPYTWGGRSSFGFDCSGFVQMLYRQMGIDLQRDARQQILDDRFQTVALEDWKGGDLVFFGEDEAINHVGMGLGNGTFIHATSSENQPWIRISSLEGWNGGTYSKRVGRQLIL